MNIDYSELILFIFNRIFVRGAKGGDGLVAHSSGGNGALVRAVFKFQEGDTIFALVGQSGTDACRSDLPSKVFSNSNSNLIFKFIYFVGIPLVEKGLSTEASQ
jgi:hypothetical protein